ncbi:MAG TPA: hypothetical protein VM621_01635 [Luteibacter sp.]|uniref:hypothetical protein n=1 Tax=Luteibacter sp. TaxID=1886636 RepID=UPI002BC52CBB|nr:hypothetical protein [Luteibacter sp.]HVI53735.1 hypothetical protein [Luteibacter sp.]
MYALVRPTLIVAALLALSCGVAVAKTTAHTAAGASTQQTPHAVDAVRCKNPAECSVPR